MVKWFENITIDGNRDAKMFECFGTANTSDCCMQCPDNTECAEETIKHGRHDYGEKKV